jgi:signal transduction histidine kinase
MKASNSLRLRLLLGTLMWILATILVAGLGLSSLFHQHVARGFHAELITHLDQLTARLELDAQGLPLLHLPLTDPRFDRPLSGLYWQIDRIQAPDKALLRSRSLWDQVLLVPDDSLVSGQVHQHSIQGPDNKALGLVERSLSLEGQKLRLMVAADEALMTEPLSRFRGALWLALSILAIGLVLAVLVQVFVGLRPLKRLQEALVQVRTGQSVKLQGDFPTEVRPLVDEFNQVLEQNSEVVERARTQAGNLAHALKMPLTILANSAQNAEVKESELARTVLAQVAVARAQVDYQLARARAAASGKASRTLTRLAPVVAGLVRTMERLHIERHLQLHSSAIPEHWIFRGEEQDLQEMLGNLLDNACKWAKARVSLDVALERDWLLLAIEDDGPGLDDSKWEQVVRRGVRADEQRPGSGLGLAIVDDLAELYGGELRLETARLGGLRAVLRLPAHGIRVLRRND